MQQVERDLEILIIDDGSTDDTVAIARRLAARDSRIGVVSLPRNAGRSFAMNHGMDLARGRWIAVLDADDWYAPERLKRLLDIADAHDVDMIADDWIAVDAEAGIALESPLPRRGSDVILDLDAFLAQSKPTARADYGMLKHIMRTEFVRRTAIKYHPRARNGQDFYFLLSFFLAGGRGLLVNTAYYYYVEPFGTISRRGSYAGRRRYRFEVMVTVNDEFATVFGPALPEHQRRRLEARGMAWHALSAFHQFREALADGLYGRALACVARAPPQFWGLLASRIAERIKTRLCGRERKILGPIETGHTLEPGTGRGDRRSLRAI